MRAVNRSTVDIDCSHIRNRQVPYELARKIRASYYLVGALLGPLRLAGKVPLPGGCDLGGRPIDQHVKGFVSMGAEVDVRNGLICAKVPSGRLAGGQVYLDMVSVGATMNIMISAVLADGLICLYAAVLRMERCADLVSVFFGTYSGTLGRSGPCILRYLWWYAGPIWSLYSSIFMVVR